MTFSRFRFIPMGSAAPEGAISCDGLVDGAGLDLSHWVGNRTPPALKADTSTEIALNFAASPLARTWRDAPVVNNHFDTDGVLACWTLMDPEGAAHRRDLIVAAAEAGDFAEWPADHRGLWLDAAILRLGEAAGSEAAAYERIFPVVADLLDGIEDREDLWGDAWTKIDAAMRLVNDDRVEVSTFGNIGVVRHGPGIDELPGPVIARLLLPRSWRYLLAFAKPDGTFAYRYERPRYAWAETVRRTPLEPPDERRLAEQIGPPWVPSPRAPGGTAIIETGAPVPQDPDVVLEVLARHDPVALASR